MTDLCPVIRINLYGMFRLETGDGRDISPRSAKACGLIALLALSPRGQRTRVWLQDRLWSDRGRDQGAASLRQALSQIRRDLGPCAGVIGATRSHVALDLARVELMQPPGDRPAPEFLEGIDIRDGEFEAWLRTERAARAAPGEGGGAGDRAGSAAVMRNRTRSVFLNAATATAGPERLFEDLFIDCLERSISEFLVADVYRRAPDPDAPDPVVVSVSAFRADGHDFGLRLSVEEGPRRRALWSGRRVVSARGAPPVDHADILSLVHEVTEALADGLLAKASRDRDTFDAAILARLAVRKIFTMNAAEIIEADALLAQAFALDPRAVFLAWRVQLRVIQRMERHLILTNTADCGIPEFLAQAQRLEPGNSMVLAAAANALVLIDGDMAAGIELARRSLAQNPANPFAWDCLSIGLLMEGKAEQAHDLQMRACTLAARSPIRHFWDMGACLTSVVTGRHEAALRLAQSASILMPEFRPPLRYMAALSAQGGDHERAFRSVERLHALEADFSIERMIGDPGYPVAALRLSGLLSGGGLRDLGR